jgi:hypothetical protein
MALAPAPNPAKLGSLIGVSVKKAESAFGGCGLAGLARFRRSFAAMILILRCHVFALASIPVSRVLLGWDSA